MTSFLRRLPAAWLLVFLAAPSGVASASDQDIEFAMQNPFLRERFRDREERILYGPMFRRANEFSQPPWGRREDDFMLERRVDQLIRLYLKSLIEKKAELKTALEDAKAASSPGGPSARGLAEALKNLKDRADDLRSTLSSVITDLPKKADFEPSLAPDSRSTGFQTELAFLEKESEAAIQGIDDFFFHPGGTVTVAGLQGGDMLQSLHRVSLMAEFLADELADDGW